MRYPFLFCIALIVLARAGAQPFSGNPRNEDRIYDDDIFSVKLHLANAPLTLPVVDLKAGNGTLVLSFDHLGGDLLDYGYRLVHCNSDWQPSDLENHEYVDGFTEDRVTNLKNSFNTLVPYVTYRLDLPNRNMRWTRSGNYLLVVYDTDDPDAGPVLVRRFCVVEQTWRIAGQFVRPSMAEKFNTHHEIDFVVNHKGARLANPQGDLQTFVLQNGRWDNAIGPLKPLVSRSEEQVFDLQDVVVFPAGKEWRLFDMRTFDVRGERIANIEELHNGYQVVLKTDTSRANVRYIYFGDLNGRYSIGTSNINQTIEQCDYADVLFTFRSKSRLENQDLYLFGELTDFQLRPEFRLTWNEEYQLYAVSAFLKQGYYNYQYLLVDRATGQPDDEGVEGNWFETGNLYTILVYFRPFGARFDRLMAVSSLDSRRRE